IDFQNALAVSTLGLVGPGTVTLGANVHIRGGLGVIGVAVFGGTAGTILNQGTITCDAPSPAAAGLTLTIGSSFSNSGTLEAGPGATVTISGGPLTSSGTIRASAGAAVTIGS